MDLRVPRVPLVQWELQVQWVPRVCLEREVGLDLVELLANVVHLETWANLDQWVHWV